MTSFRLREMAAITLNNQARLAKHPMRVRVHVQSFNALIYMVEAGVGAAVVLASTVEEAIHNAWLRPRSQICGRRELSLVHADEPGQPELV